MSFNGAGTTVPWFVDPVGAATISGNTFGASDQYIRHRHGTPDSAVFSTWASYWTGNTFARAAIATTDGNPANVVSYSYTSSYSFPLGRAHRRDDPTRARQRLLPGPTATVSSPTRPRAERCCSPPARSTSG